MKRVNGAAALGALALGSGLLLAASLFVGAERLSPADVIAALGSRDARHVIVVDLRLARALLAFVVGAALAGSGTVFQGLFRNPLADPFVVGVSGGAALGAVGALVSGAVATTVAGLSAVTVCAFAGALAAVWVVYGIARVGGRVPLASLLLAGFAVGAFASAAVSILLLLHPRSWNEILLWFMGSLERPDPWLRVRVAFPIVAAALGVASVYARDLNAMLLGEEPAQQLGVEVERVKKALLAVGAVSAAVAVSMCGVIGFVGLLVPHVVRLLAGPDHRTLLPVTALAGGAFLVAADLVARVALSPSGLPVGAVTALAGAPFFIALLRRRRSRLG